MQKTITKFVVTTFFLTASINLHAGVIVEDFEHGIAGGNDVNGAPVGFLTFASSGSSAVISPVTSYPSSIPGEAAGNTVIQFDADIEDVPPGGFSGFLQIFGDIGATWSPQDWSGYDSLNFWLYGNNTGNDLFVDILDNRSSGSVIDDAERWVSEFTDDFSGWGMVSLSFDDFTRKDVFPTAPNDGFGLTEVNGWAFGTTTAGEDTYYIDDVSLVPEPATLALLGIGLAGIGFARRKQV